MEVIVLLTWSIAAIAQPLSGPRSLNPKLQRLARNDQNVVMEQKVHTRTEIDANSDTKRICKPYSMLTIVLLSLSIVAIAPPPTGPRLLRSKLQRYARNNQNVATDTRYQKSRHGDIEANGGSK